MKLNLFSKLLVSTASILAALSAVQGLDKRNPAGSFSLIAYGTAPSYIDIFYSDGIPLLFYFHDNQDLIQAYRTCLRW